MATGKNLRNNSRRKPPKKGWWYLVTAILTVAAVFILLELKHDKGRKVAVVKGLQGTVQREHRPELPNYGMHNYTTGPASPPATKEEVQPVKQHGRVAVIVDDMGSSVNEARELLSIKLPITFAIIPGLSRVKGVAEAASAAGAEIMVHLPMEPQGYPRQRLEDNGLLARYAADEITERTEKLVASVPSAVGANNHMGSRFTELEDKMLPVMTVLQKRGLYFIDSRTTPRSVGFETARKLGVKTATRNVFLDNEQDVSAIRKQLSAAAKIAQIKGSVIAICHPHPVTIQALKAGMPELKREGIQFVTAGALVR